MRDYLTRIDADQNMRRFYLLDIQPTLFGEFALVREWGRIGRCGQVRIIHYSTPAEAEAVFERLRQTKARRGYSAAY